MYIGYDNERKGFYLMRNQNDYMDWILIDWTGLTDEEEQRIKDSDEALSCSISISLD